MINESKAELRLFYKSKRNSVHQSVRHEKSKIICELALNYFNNNKKYKTFMVYQSFSSEVETGEYIKALVSSGNKVLIPHCNIKTETMRTTIYDCSKKQTKNSYGIQEFVQPEFTDEKIDVIIVPGIAFDEFGNRIGFGKGYYDKFVHSQKNKPLLVAFCYAEQMHYGRIPADEFDIKMDMIITDKGIYKIRE